MGNSGAESKIDYQLVDTAIRFAPNQRRQTAIVDIVSDSLDEQREYFTLHLQIIDGSGKVDPVRKDAIVGIEDHSGL